MLIQDATILVVDDDPFHLLLLDEYLGQTCKNLIIQNCHQLALALAISKKPDIILLDINMPNMDGYEVCRHLKATEETCHIPVIFFSALLESADRVAAFEVGGVDFITKPFTQRELLVRIESCLKNQREVQHTQTDASEARSPTPTSQEPIESPAPDLSKREIEVLTLYVLGYKYKDISKQLFISEHTVKWHLKQIYSKLAIKDRSEAIKKAHKIGLLSL